MIQRGAKLRRFLRTNSSNSPALIANFSQSSEVVFRGETSKAPHLHTPPLFKCGDDFFKDGDDSAFGIGVEQPVLQGDLFDQFTACHVQLSGFVDGAGDVNRISRP